MDRVDFDDFGALDGLYDSDVFDGADDWDGDWDDGVFDVDMIISLILVSRGLIEGRGRR